MEAVACRPDRPRPPALGLRPGGGRGSHSVRDRERDGKRDAERDGEGIRMMRWRGGGIGAAARFQLLRRRPPAARAGHGPEVRPGAALRVCGRWPARLTLERPRGGPAAAGLLRCHVTALRQRRSAHAAPARNRQQSDRVRPERPDRAAGERPAPRGEVPAALPVAPRGRRRSRGALWRRTEGGRRDPLPLTEGAAAADTSYRVVGPFAGVCDMTSLDGREGDERRRESLRLASRQDRKLCRRAGSAMRWPHGTPGSGASTGDAITTSASGAAGRCGSRNGQRLRRVAEPCVRPVV